MGVPSYDFAGDVLDPVVLRFRVSQSDLDPVGFIRTALASGQAQPDRRWPGFPRLPPARLIAALAELRERVVSAGSPRRVRHSKDREDELVTVTTFRVAKMAALAAAITAVCVPAAQADDWFHDGRRGLVQDGTYRTSFTRDQLRSPGVDSQQRSAQSGVWTLTISSGRWTLTNRQPGIGDDWGRDVPHDQRTGTYSTTGTGIAFVQNTPAAGAERSALRFTWSSQGKALQFRATASASFTSPIVKSIWTKHSWIKMG
jgi:hypothetical protein